MATQRFFREQELPVYLKFKNTFRACNECKCLDYMLVITEYVICHTGSALPVVSRHAIFKSDDVFLFHLWLTPQFFGDTIQFRPGLDGIEGHPTIISFLKMIDHPHNHTQDYVELVPKY
jgi:hypothetical protein